MTNQMQDTIEDQKRRHLHSQQAQKPQNVSLKINNQYQSNSRSRYTKPGVRSSRTGTAARGKKIQGRSIKNATSYDTLNAAVNQTFNQLGIAGGPGLNQSVVNIVNPLIQNNQSKAMQPHYSMEVNQISAKKDIHTLVQRLPSSSISSGLNEHECIMEVPKLQQPKISTD